MNGQEVELGRSGMGMKETSLMGREEARDAVTKTLREGKYNSCAPSIRDEDQMIAMVNEFVRREEYGN